MSIDDHPDAYSAESRFRENVDIPTRPYSPATARRTDDSLFEPFGFAGEPTAMSTNHLVTGYPRSGKTTVIERTVDRLTDLDVCVGGFYSPELRVDGERVGFELVDTVTNERVTMAHVDWQDAPRVGKYSVAVEAVDEFAKRALPDARAGADLVVIDEIASMQLHSDVFVDELELTLDSDRPVLAAIQSNSSFEFVKDIKRRRDARLYRVTPETRESLPEQLAARLRNRGK